MQILVGPVIENGMVLSDVVFVESINGHDFQAHINVWVPDVDSRSELEKLAVAEARKFLERVLSAPDA